MTIGNRCLQIASLFLWASVFVIPFGTHLQARSEAFDDYQRVHHRATAAVQGGRDTGADMSFLEYAWPVIGLWCLCIVGLFRSGVRFLRWVSTWNRDLALLACGAFGSGCLLGALIGLGQAAMSLYWGFGVLALGYLLSMAGLVLGTAGVTGDCLAARCT